MTVHCAEHGNIPLKDFPEGFVLNSLYVMNVETLHGGSEEILDLHVFSRSALQLYSLGKEMSLISLQIIYTLF